jgi:hypothetical protein
VLISLSVRGYAISISITYAMVWLVGEFCRRIWRILRRPDLPSSRHQRPKVPSDGRLIAESIARAVSAGSTEKRTSGPRKAAQRHRSYEISKRFSCSVPDFPPASPHQKYETRRRGGLHIGSVKTGNSKCGNSEFPPDRTAV